ncbi:MAG TPA: AI-2E family transporter [Patescibacteria group bacterium]|nr:AI-2E family transporter [Patescibacteria group bacterium]
MELKNFNTYFFFFVLIAVSVGAFLLLQPFLGAIFVAAILAVMFQRPYKFFLKIVGGRAGISASLTCIIVLFVIVLPIFGIVGAIVNEVSSFVQEVATDGTMEQQFVLRVSDYVRSVPFVESVDVRDVLSHKDFSASIQNIGGWVVTAAQKTYQGAVGFVFWVLVMFFTLFYFFIDGKRIISIIMQLSPLRDAHEKLLVTQFVSMSRATLKGSLVIGLVQGAIGGAIFLLTGVASPVIWTVIMILLSLLPMVGAGLVWAPIGIIMLILGHVWEGIAILAVGILVISTIDNVLRPKLVGRDTQMHPLLVFFSTLGGIVLFGFIGFIVGPILMALFLSLWKIYGVEFNTQLREYNA